jgi:transposase
LKDWIIAAMKSKILAFAELGLKFFRKRHFILNYFVCNITTAISKGINIKIKRLSRMAYSFKDVYYFLLKIHQHCGMLNPWFSNEIRKMENVFGLLQTEWVTVSETAGRAGASLRRN